MFIIIAKMFLKCCYCKELDKTGERNDEISTPDSLHVQFFAQKYFHVFNVSLLLRFWIFFAAAANRLRDIIEGFREQTESSLKSPIAVNCG